MNERIRILRENQSLSRAAFGEKLGVSGDVINNLERGRVEPKDSIIKLICAVYSANEEWLRSGNGDMYVQSNMFSLDEYARANALSELETSIIRNFMILEPSTRNAIYNVFFNALSANNVHAANGLIFNSTEAAEAEYIKSRSASAQSITSSASNTTDGTENKAVNQ